MNFSDRIECSDLAPDYVPNFTYRVVSLHNYSNWELKRHQDEMSLLMMCNRVQTAMDYVEFLNTSKDFIDKIYKNMPEDIKKIYREVLWSLLIKMNVPTEKAQTMMDQLEESSMGVLFANMEFDIQEEWRKTREAQREAQEAQKAQDEAQNYLSALIITMKKQNLPREQMIKNLQELCGIAESEAIQAADRFLNRE